MRVSYIFDDELSEVPSIPYELQSRIIALQLEINDLIQNQTNHLVLKWLVKIFNAQLIHCKSKLPDSDVQELSSVTMCDLPLEQKRLIYLSSAAHSILISMLAQASGIPYEEEEFAESLTLKIFTDLQSTTDSEVEQFIFDFVFSEIS